MRCSVVVPLLFRVGQNSEKVKCKTDRSKSTSAESWDGVRADGILARPNSSRCNILPAFPRPPQFVKFPNPFFSRFQNSSYREPLLFHKKPASVVGVVRTET